MGQEYFINSQELQSKINSLLPSQGGAGAGVDLSASTQIVPIIDLTESAEGSQVRPDLQTAYSYTNINFNTVVNTTTDIVVNTGYYSIFGFTTTSSAGGGVIFYINNGGVQKKLFQMSLQSGVIEPLPNIIVKLEAGDSLQALSGASTVVIYVGTRQIADIDGNLIPA